MSEESQTPALDPTEEYGMDAYMDMGVEDVSVEDAGESGGVFYRPSLKNQNVENNQYKAMGRFILNAHDKIPKDKPRPVKNVISKYQYFLLDPDDPSGDGVVVVDDQSFLNRNNFLTVAYLTLKDHQSIRIKQQADKYFKRKQYFYSLYSPLIDEFDKDAEGKILIFRYGKQVYDKVLELAKSDPKFNKKGYVAFNPIKSKDFTLFIDKDYVGEGKKRKLITNYNKSYFSDDPSQWLPEELKGKVTDEMTKENFQFYIDYIRENAPDLAEVEPKEWTEEIEYTVLRSMRETIDDQRVFEMVVDKSWKKSGGKGAFVMPDGLGEGDNRAENDSSDDEGDEPSLRSGNVTARSRNSMTMDEDATAAAGSAADTLSGGSKHQEDPETEKADDIGKAKVDFDIDESELSEDQPEQKRQKVTSEEPKKNALEDELANEADESSESETDDSGDDDIDLDFDIDTDEID